MSAWSFNDDERTDNGTMRAAPRDGARSGGHAQPADGAMENTLTGQRPAGAKPARMSGGSVPPAKNRRTDRDSSAGASDSEQDRVEALMEEAWGGGWKIEGKPLGSGSFGKVYKVSHTDMIGTRYAAVKHLEIPTDQRQVDELYANGVTDDVSITAYYRDSATKLLAEIQYMDQVKGLTNFVSYEDSCILPKKEGYGYDVLIRMELLTSLYEEMKKRSSFPVSEAVEVGIDICTALEKLQVMQIVHRDVKPQNILFNSLGDYKLGDFGISKVIGHSETMMTSAGTEPYMAPEIRHGKPAGFSADQYSLGIVLYRLLNANRAPFLPAEGSITHHDLDEALNRRMTGEVLPKPAYADDRLAAIILRACSYQPEDRYPSASALKQALLAYRDHPGQETPEASAPETVPPRVEQAETPATPTMTAAAFAAETAPDKAPKAAPEERGTASAFAAGKAPDKASKAEPEERGTASAFAAGKAPDKAPKAKPEERGTASAFAAGKAPGKAPKAEPEERGTASAFAAGKAPDKAAEPGSAPKDEAPTPEKKQPEAAEKNAPAPDGPEHENVHTVSAFPKKKPQPKPEPAEPEPAAAPVAEAPVAEAKAPERKPDSRQAEQRPQAAPASEKEAKEESGGKKKNKALLIIIPVVIVAIAAVIIAVASRGKKTPPPAPAHTFPPLSAPTATPEATRAPASEPPAEVLPQSEEAMVLNGPGAGGWLVFDSIPDGAEVFYTSSDPEILTVTEDGWITAVSCGEATVSVRVCRGEEELASADYPFRVAPSAVIISASVRDGVGGTIEPSGEVEVPGSEPQTFEIRPEEGFRIIDVLVNGESVGPTERYIFGVCEEAQTIEAIFAPLEAAGGSEEETYVTATLKAGPGGSISPSGEVQVRAWYTLSFTVTPDPGYQISDVLVNGKSIGAVSSYTMYPGFDQNIEARFTARSAGSTPTPTPGGSSDSGNSGSGNSGSGNSGSAPKEDCVMISIGGKEYRSDETKLSLQSKNLSDISVLSQFTNLQTLYLDHNSISDLSPLSGLTSLTHLYLSNNSISDLSPLSGLTSLTHLYLNYNNISDISPLSGLKNLTTVQLQGNSVTDWSPLDFVPTVAGRS